VKDVGANLPLSANRHQLRRAADVGVRANIQMRLFALTTLIGSLPITEAVLSSFHQQPFPLYPETG
jgi:hypothetical protein